jgi:hypothetical protein
MVLRSATGAKIFGRVSMTKFLSLVALSVTASVLAGVLAQPLAAQ